MTTVAAAVRSDGSGVTFASDTQATRGHRRDRGEHKVFSNGPVFFGYSGSVRGADILQHAVEVPKFGKKARKNPRKWVVKELVPAMRKAFDAHGALSEHNGMSSAHVNTILAVPGFVGVLYSDFSVLEAQEYVAVGSGEEYAMGAMALGAGPDVAVGVASKFDVYTDSEVHVLEVEWA